MKYAEMKSKQQKIFDEFAEGKIYYIFALSDHEFNKQLKEYGLNMDDIRSIGGGGFIRREYYKDFIELIKSFTKEQEEAIAQDKTGNGFIKSMFLYELNNHEFAYTQDIFDTLDYLDLTLEQINKNQALKKGLMMAIELINKSDEE